MVRGNFEKRLEQANARKQSSKSRKAADTANSRLSSLLKRPNGRLFHIFASGGTKACGSVWTGAPCKDRRCRLNHDLPVPSDLGDLTPVEALVNLIDISRYFIVSDDNTLPDRRDLDISDITLVMESYEAGSGGVVYSKPGGFVEIGKRGDVDGDALSPPPPPRAATKKGGMVFKLIPESVLGDIFTKWVSPSWLGSLSLTSKDNSTLLTPTVLKILAAHYRWPVDDFKRNYKLNNLVTPMIYVEEICDRRSHFDTVNVIQPTLEPKEPKLEVNEFLQNVLLIPPPISSPNSPWSPLAVYSSGATYPGSNDSVKSAVYPPSRSTELVWTVASATHVVAYCDTQHNGDRVPKIFATPFGIVEAGGPYLKNAPGCYEHDVKDALKDYYESNDFQKVSPSRMEKVHHANPGEWHGPAFYDSLFAWELLSYHCTEQCYLSCAAPGLHSFQDDQSASACELLGKPEFPAAFVGEDTLIVQLYSFCMVSVKNAADLNHLLQKMRMGDVSESQIEREELLTDADAVPNFYIVTTLDAIAFKISPSALRVKKVMRRLVVSARSLRKHYDLRPPKGRDTTMEDQVRDFLDTVRSPFTEILLETYNAPMVHYSYEISRAPPPPHPDICKYDSYEGQKKFGIQKGPLWRMESVGIDAPVKCPQCFETKKEPNGLLIRCPSCMSHICCSDCLQVHVLSKDCHIKYCLRFFGHEFGILTVLRHRLNSETVDLPRRRTDNGNPISMAWTHHTLHNKDGDVLRRGIMGPFERETFPAEACLSYILGGAKLHSDQIREWHSTPIPTAYSLCRQTYITRAVTSPPVRTHVKDVMMQRDLVELQITEERHLRWSTLSFFSTTGYLITEIDIPETYYPRNTVAVLSPTHFSIAGVTGYFESTHRSWTQIEQLAAKAASPQKPTGKKKNKKLQKKKDSFARGQSLRG